jgi:hypothetical protein
MPNMNIVREFFRCDLCHRSVDADTQARARRAWQPLVICELCVRDAQDARPLRAAN